MSFDERVSAKSPSNEASLSLAQPVDLPAATRRAMSAPARRLQIISFDIDGTLEVGEPPGIIPIDLVRRAQRLGYLIGSCSDRPISHQRELWDRLGIAAAFTVLKHRLEEVKAQYSAAAYYHIGDTDIDDYYATAAGFRFLKADAAAHRSWGPELFASPDGVRSGEGT